MWSRVYVIVGRPSVCLFHRLTAASAAGEFAAERRRLQQISIDSCGRLAAGAGIQLQMQVVSCLEPMEADQHIFVSSRPRVSCGGKMEAPLGYRLRKPRTASVFTLVID